MNQDTLELSQEEMRALGYRVVDLLSDHFGRLGEKRVGTKGDPAILRPALLEPPPAKPVPPDEIFATLARDVFTNMMNVGHLSTIFCFRARPFEFRQRDGGRTCERNERLHRILARRLRLGGGRTGGDRLAAAMVRTSRECGWAVRQRRFHGEPHRDRRRASCETE